MSELKDQILNTCIHFTGIQNKECKAGVLYADVIDKSVKPFRWPCMKSSPFSGGKDCSEECFPSEQEAESEAEVLKRESSEVLSAFLAVKDLVAKGEAQGEIDCPKCASKLKFSSASNGHTRGWCKCGIKWME